MNSYPDALPSPSKVDVIQRLGEIMDIFRDRTDDRPTTTTDLESRLVALEIISMSALALALDTDEASASHAGAVSRLIVETVEKRCHELGMDSQAQKAASGYAERLLGTAITSLYPQTQ